MDIQLLCSELIQKSICRIITKSEINISADAKIVLVERGFDKPPGKLAVVSIPLIM
jgi:hypothetical protein